MSSSQPRITASTKAGKHKHPGTVNSVEKCSTREKHHVMKHYMLYMQKETAQTRRLRADNSRAKTGHAVLPIRGMDIHSASTAEHACTQERSTQTDASTIFDRASQVRSTAFAAKFQRRSELASRDNRRVSSCGCFCWQWAQGTGQWKVHRLVLVDGHWWHHWHRQGVHGCRLRATCVAAGIPEARAARCCGQV